MTQEGIQKVELCSDPSGRLAFIESENEWLMNRQKLLSKNFMNPENTVRYNHRGDVRHQDTNDDESGQMKPHSATRTIRFEDVKNNDLEAWASGLIQMADELHESVMGMMFQTINASTEKTGNVVDAKQAGSFPEAFIEMLEKIEFGVDRNGEVSMPVIAVPPGIAEKQIAELEAQPPEFQDRVEAVKARKTQDALAREEARKARFRCRK